MRLLCRRISKLWLNCWGLRLFCRVETVEWNCSFESFEGEAAIFRDSLFLTEDSIPRLNLKASWSNWFQTGYPLNKYPLPVVLLETRNCFLVCLGALIMIFIFSLNTHLSTTAKQFISHNLISDICESVFNHISLRYVDHHLGLLDSDRVLQIPFHHLQFRRCW